MELVTLAIGDMLGDSMYEVWLLTRRRREARRESLRARSCCRLSSRCSGVKDIRGGLEVSELVTLGGVRLGSDPWFSDEAVKSLWIMLSGDVLDSSGPA